MFPEQDKNNSQNDTDEKKYEIQGYNNFQDFMKDGFKTLMEAIRHSNNLPQGSDWNFYNTHDGFVKIINDESTTVLKQINTILRTNQTEGNIYHRGLDEKTELIVEGNDNILERVAINIDEMNGIRKTGNAPILIQSVSAELPINGSWNQVNNATFSVTSLATQGKPKNKGSVMRLLTAKNIIRPQTFFKDKIINSSSFPWEPRIKDKPNSLKPLAIFLEETQNGEEYSHPYEFELERFTPSPEQLLTQTPIKPLPIEVTPLIEVSEPHQLDDLLNDLRNCKEFAVDLEHHSYRTFMGITCLMQISTREKDYLIDTLTLRDTLHVLNEVFTKPTILKVFHGADSDILWLQRDLSIYVVNMFDTYYAAKKLEYSGLSLAYLMQRFCNFVPDKQFQLADWRMRPLPDNLKCYAREDTHYLLYVYDMLKNELLSRTNGHNLLLSVFDSSTEVCKKRYFKPVLREDSYLDFYRKCKRLFDNRQLYALKELYRWRDEISRKEDESTGYVLPNHMLLQIAETLPREMQGILACCNPIPPLVRSNLLELHHIILRAKEQSLEKPILQEDTRARGTTKKMSKINVDSQLNCPHDLTKSSEFRDDLPTILGKALESNISALVVSKLEKESTTPKCSVFNTPDNSDDDEQRIKAREKMQTFKFLGPFERYKLVRPYIQAEEEKLSKDKEESKASQKPEEDTRTDEERIESIRELFLSLAKKTAPDSENLDRSLVQMGGRKRKRETLPPPQSTSHHPVFLPISNKTIEEDNPRKRRSSGVAPDDVSPPKRKKQKKPKNNSRNNKNNPEEFSGTSRDQDEQNQQRFSGEQDPGNQQHPQSQKGKNKKKKQQKNRNGPQGQTGKYNQPGWNPQNQGQLDNPNQREQHDQGQKRQRNRGPKDQQHQNQRGQTSQSGISKDNQNQEFAAYDYSSVDFRQFQGGAGTVSKPQEFKSNFKFKGKKTGANRGNNRSSTIGTAPRGGGRGRSNRGGGGGGRSGSSRGGGGGGGRGKGRGR